MAAPGQDGVPADRGPRRSSVTVRCAWCGAVKATEGWIPDRRKKGLRQARATDTICPTCRDQVIRGNGNQ